MPPICKYLTDSGYTAGENGGNFVGNDTLLAHMEGHSASGTTPGDICKVLAAKQGSRTECKIIRLMKIKQLQDSPSAIE
jgi:hypothetical protein